MNRRTIGIITIICGTLGLAAIAAIQTHRVFDLRADLKKITAVAHTLTVEREEWIATSIACFDREQMQTGWRDEHVRWIDDSATSAKVDTVYDPKNFTVVHTGTGFTTLELIRPDQLRDLWSGSAVDTSTWVIHLEDGEKKLDVLYGKKVFRFRPKDGQINLDTIITETP